MSHFEGPIVDAFYEVALHSWHNELSPPLPCLAQPYTPPRDAQGRIRYLFQDQNPYFDDIEILKAAKAARELLRQQTKDLDDEKNAGAAEEHRFRDAVQKGRRQMADSWAEWKPGEELNARAQVAMNELREFRDRWGLGSSSRAGSRSNSRAPSRRASADLGFRHGREYASSLSYSAADYTDKETAAITAHNAHLPVDPSEAPSTPTIVADLPPKSKSYPIPQTDHTASQPDSPRTVLGELGDGHERGRKGVLFLDTDAIDGTGRLFDKEGATVPSPKSARAASVCGREIVTASPLPAEAPLPENSPPPVVARDFDAEDVPALGAEDAPALGAPQETTLPATAPTDELPRSGLIVDDTDTEADVTERHARFVPVRSMTVGTTDSDIPPEGTGSKRMFKMSKMFSEWAWISPTDCQTPRVS